jgi:hypothetical protein
MSTPPGTVPVKVAAVQAGNSVIVNPGGDRLGAARLLRECWALLSNSADGGLVRKSELSV